MTATRTRLKPRPRRTTVLLEGGVVKLGKPERVDRDRGILYGVKFLGLESDNDRRYLPEAVGEAIRLKLYEGCAVNADHPRRPDDPRSSHDVFGWLENVREAKEGGGRADFRLAAGPDWKLDPLAVRLMNAADSNPTIYGFSHNAEGEGHTDADGVFVVEEITKVRSVDLVAEPATTDGLFEGKRPMPKTTVRKLLESALPQLKKAGRKRAAARLKALLEADDDMALLDADVDGAPAGDWKTCLADALHELVQSDDPAAHEIAAKVQKLLKPDVPVEEEEEGGADKGPKQAGAEHKGDRPGSGNATGADNLGESEDEEEMAEGAACDAPKKKPYDEGRQPRKLAPGVKALQEQVDALKANLKAEKDRAALSTWLAEECSRRKVAVGVKLTETLLSIGDRKEILARLDELKALSTGRQLPRSQGQRSGALVEGLARAPTDGKSFAESLHALAVAN